MRQLPRGMRMTSHGPDYHFRSDVIVSLVPPFLATVDERFRIRDGRAQRVSDIVVDIPPLSAAHASVFGAPEGCERIEYRHILTENDLTEFLTFTRKDPEGNPRQTRQCRVATDGSRAYLECLEQGFKAYLPN